MFASYPDQLVDHQATSADFFPIPDYFQIGLDNIVNVCFLFCQLTLRCQDPAKVFQIH